MTEADRILVGVDGSRGSRAALRWALRYADRAGGEITALIASGIPAMIDIVPGASRRPVSFGGGERARVEPLGAPLRDRGGSGRRPSRDPGTCGGAQAWTKARSGRPSAVRP